VRSCTIITCQANELVAPIHDRMPVILAPEDHTRWLGPAAGDPRSLLEPCPAAWLESFPVNPRVNDPRHDDPECIQPVLLQDTLAL
jgi:putative SOS response-associated peptidase YedK